jgi:hypothetical protein
MKKKVKEINEKHFFGIKNIDCGKGHTLVVK